MVDASTSPNSVASRRSNPAAPAPSQPESPSRSPEQTHPDRPAISPATGRPRQSPPSSTPPNKRTLPPSPKSAHKHPAIAALRDSSSTHGNPCNASQTATCRAPHHPRSDPPQLLQTQAPNHSHPTHEPTQPAFAHRHRRSAHANESLDTAPAASHEPASPPPSSPPASAAAPPGSAPTPKDSSPRAPSIHPAPSATRPAQTSHTAEPASGPNDNLRTSPPAAPAPPPEPGHDRGSASRHRESHTAPHLQTDEPAPASTTPQPPPRTTVLQPSSLSRRLIQRSVHKRQRPAPSRILHFRNPQHALQLSRRHH